jgi:hypothetical protein
MIRRWLREIASYVRTPSGVPDDVSRSIRDEIEFHLTESARRQMERGLSADKACHTAVQQFGDVEAAVRGCAETAATGHARLHRAHLAVTALSIVAVSALGAWIWMNPPGEPAPGDGDISGQVVDEQARPVSNAHVLAVVKTWPKQSYRQLAYVAITRADGTFEIANVYPTDEKYAVQIAVVADGKRLESSYVNLREGPLEPISFQLTSTPPLTVRFETADGQPLEGVDVFPSERIETGGARHMVYFCSGGPVVQRSDSAGRVSLPYFSPGDAASLYVRTPGGEWNVRRLDIPHDGEEVVLRVRGGKGVEPSDAT